MSLAPRFSSDDRGSGEASFKHNPQVATPPSGPSGRKMDADVVRFVGGRFQDNTDVEWRDLDPGDFELDPTEEATHVQNLSVQARPSEPSESTGRSNVQRSRGSPATPRGLDRSPHLYAPGSYLSQAEFTHFQRSRRPLSNRRSHDSSQPTDISVQYRTEDDYPASETTIEDNGSRFDDRDPAPSFTPSHTPSQRSEASAEDNHIENDHIEDDHIEDEQHFAAGRAPDSPHPFSGHYYPYNANYSRGVVEIVNQCFHE